MIQESFCYFTDSEVRQWQAIDTSLGATPQAPKEGGESHLKRTRSHQVSFRLNDKEYALLHLSKPSAKEK